MAITPARAKLLRHGVNFHACTPDVIDVAIAEQHAVTFAAGLAIGGYKPVKSTLTFLQRAYDQVIHDVAIQKSAGHTVIDRCRYRWRGWTNTPARSIFLSALHHPGYGGDHDAKRRKTNVARCYLPGITITTARRQYVIHAVMRRACQTPLEKLPIGKGLVKRHGEKLAILELWHLNA